MLLKEPCLFQATGKKALSSTLPWNSHSSKSKISKSSLILKLNISWHKNVMCIKHFFFTKYCFQVLWCTGVCKTCFLENYMLWMGVGRIPPPNKSIFLACIQNVSEPFGIWSRLEIGLPWRTLFLPRCAYMNWRCSYEPCREFGLKFQLSALH